MPKNPKRSKTLDKKFPMFTVGNRSIIYSLTDDGPDGRKRGHSVFGCCAFPFMPVSATNLFIKEEVFTVFRKRVKEI